MIHPIAVANAIAVTTAGLALFLMALRLLVPQFFVFFFNAQFFGANVASLLPAEAQVGVETGESQRVSRTQLVGCIASGGWHHLAVLHDGAVMAWGRNNFGQLGIGESGEETRREAPVRVPGITTAVAVSAGSEHSLVLLKDGTVLAWGRNDWWQHGNGTQEDFRRETTRNQDSAVPIQVSGLAPARAIAAGPEYSVAVLEDGTVRTWGKGDAGRLGDGVLVSRQTLHQRTIPVPVRGLTDVVAVAAGSCHTLALLADGTVCAWGCNERGQLGNGKTESSAVPVEVVGLRNIMAVAAGDQHSLALLTDGTIRAWGGNSQGELGNDVVHKPLARDRDYDRSLPTPVKDIANAVAIGARFQSLAVLADGTVRAWGHGYYGALGDGTKNKHATLPVVVKGVKKAVAVTGGGSNGMALLADGTIQVWGAGYRSGKGVSRWVPEPLSGLSNVCALPRATVP